MRRRCSPWSTPISSPPMLCRVASSPPVRGRDRLRCCAVRRSLPTRPRRVAEAEGHHTLAEQILNEHVVNRTDDNLPVPDGHVRLEADQGV